jgi:Rod binding domain-containing protein
MVSVSNQVANPAVSATGTTQPRLVKAAHDFEASMMQELLKPLQHDSLFSEDENDDSIGSESALADFSSEALGRALSEHGGFGIAKRILDHFAGKDAVKSTTSETNTSPSKGANY